MIGLVWDVVRFLLTGKVDRSARRSCRCASSACSLPAGRRFLAELDDLDVAEIRRRLDAHDRRMGARR